jgi:hypothetical protein
VSVSNSLTSQKDAGEISLNEYYVLLALGGAMNGALGFIAEIIYLTFTDWAVFLENHEYEVEMRGSRIMKSFIFQFVVCYITLFYYAFVLQDLPQLAGNLLT